MDTSWITALLSVGAFFVFAVLLAMARVRSRGKLSLETREIAAAIVAVGIGLFLLGEFDEIAYGDFRLVRKIAAEAKTAVGDRIANSPTTVEYEPINDAARKAGTNAIDEYLRRGVEALGFDLGRTGYYVPTVVREYLLRLTQAPYLKFLVFYEKGGTMRAVADARAIADRIRARDPRLTPEALTDWIVNSDLARLKTLPGYVEPVGAKSSTREALVRMLEFNADFVPVRGENGRFVGIARGSQLIGILVSALATAETR